MGTHAILLTVDDGNGGTNTDTVLVTIQDTTPPTLSGVPGTINATATRANGAIVTYTAPTATDLVGPVTLNCSPASGSLFPLGTSTVTCTATDAAGNQATATFPVKVTFAWSGFTHPKPDGSSVFKLGKVVKVSFQLTGASAGITDAVATFSFRKVDSTPGAVNKLDFLEPPTAGNLFEYQGGEYVYKWGTDAGTTGPGTYEVRADLHDGVQRTVTLDLR